MRLLDLFSGPGGAAAGYARAGFDVVGVDLEPQPRYPFPFVQADALAVLRGEVDGVDPLSFDAIHASPPCQAYSSATRDPGRHPDLYLPTVEALEELGRPWVVENVIGAPYRSGFVLCGSAFPLSGVTDPDGRPVWVRRHRNFETSWLVLGSPPCAHEDAELVAGRPVIVAGKGGTSWADYRHSRHAPRSLWPELLGVPWATPEEVRLAVPPAYTEWVGRELLAVL